MFVLANHRCLRQAERVNLMRCFKHVEQIICVARHDSRNVAYVQKPRSSILRRLPCALGHYSIVPRYVLKIVRAGVGFKNKVL